MSYSNPFMKGIDPEIPVSLALTYTDGNQSKLANILGVSRSAVSSWYRNADLLPPLHAHRLVKIFPNCLQDL